MGEVRVRNVDDEVISEWKARARRNGRSVGAELRDLLTGEAQRPRREAVAELERFQEAMRAKYGEMPDSAPGIRAERDARG
jgi:plasmid stability protein